MRSYFSLSCTINDCLKKNQSTPRPSEHPPVMGEKMSKRLGGIKGCKLFPDPSFLLFVLQNIAGYKNAVECLLQ